MNTPSLKIDVRAAGAAANDAVNAALSLLYDHLEGALDHSNFIHGAHVSLGASVASGASGRAILRQNRQVVTFVADMRARELAVALRLTQAIVIADRLAGLERAHSPIAALVRSGAVVLVDAGGRAAEDREDLSAFAFLISRRLLSAETTALPDDIAVGDDFAVLGVAPLADLRAFLETALRAVDNQIGR